MTTALPLLPVVTAAPSPQGQNTMQDNALAAGSAGGGFAATLQALPGKAGSPQALLGALRQLLSAVADGTGKGLPATLTPDQLAGLLQAAGPALKAALQQALRGQHQDGAVTGSPSADLLAMLQQLLGAPPPAAGSGVDSPDAAATGGGVGKGPLTLAQVLSALHLDGSGPGAGAGAGQVQAAPGATPAVNDAAAMTTASTGTALQAQIALSLSSAAAATDPTALGAQGDSPAATTAPLAVAALFDKLFSQAGGKGQINLQGTTAADKALLTAIFTGDKQTGSGGGSNATAPTPLYSPALAAQAGAVPIPGAATASLPVPVPFNQQGWDQAVGHNVLWMAKNDLQVASMRLNPPHLGPLEVRVSFNNDQASVTFVVHHAAVRDAVESALPRLREMFADGGVNLGHVGVSDQASSGGNNASGFGHDSSSGPFPSENGPALTAAPASAVAAAALPLGLVDYFA